MLKSGSSCGFPVCSSRRGLSEVLAGLLLMAASAFALTSCNSLSTTTQPTAVVAVKAPSTGINASTSVNAMSPSSLLSGAASVFGTTASWNCLTGTTTGAECASLEAARMRRTSSLFAATVVAPPGAPSGLAASVTGTTITFSWTAPTTGGPVTSYSLEAGLGSGLADLANSDLGSASTSFTATNVPAGNYYARVRAKNSGGVSPPSNEVTVRVNTGGGGGTCTVAPSPATNLVATVTGTTLSMTWTAGANAIDYVVQAGTRSGLSDIGTQDVGNATTFTANNVGPGTYVLRVVAKNGCGPAAASNEMTATVAGGSGGNGTSTWKGTFTGQDGSSGSVTVTLTVATSGQVNGTFSISGTNNGTTSSAAITGTTTGSLGFNFSSSQFTDSTGCQGQLTGSATLTGTTAGSTMSGTLTINDGAGCGGRSNTSFGAQFSATKQ